MFKASGVKEIWLAVFLLHGLVYIDGFPEAFPRRTFFSIFLSTLSCLFINYNAYLY